MMLGQCSSGTDAGPGAGPGAPPPPAPGTDPLDNAIARAVPLGPARVATPESQTYIPVLPGKIGAETSGTALIQGVGAPRGGDAPDLTYLYGTRTEEIDVMRVTNTNSIMFDTDGAIVTGSGAQVNTVYQDRDRDTQLGTEFARVGLNQTGLNYVQVGNYRDASGTTSLVYGVSTAAGDMPAAGTLPVGTVVYGDGEALFAETEGGTVFSRGTARATVNFAAADVDLVATPPNTAQGFDELRATDMVVSGNAFTGGRVALRLGGVDVTESVTGPVAGSASAGLFFGPAQPVPAEIGGTVVIDGATRDLVVNWVASE